MNYLNIISLFQENLKKGVAALFNDYGQPLYGYSVRHWHLNEDDAYDTLYKTLEIVGKVIGRYEFSSEAHFKNWIFKIHRNNILQLLRSKKTKEIEIRSFTYSDWESEVKALENEAFEISDYKYQIETLENSTNLYMIAIDKALQQISEVEKEILLLRMSNYSYDEIAKMLKMENNQLKVKFNRAKAKVEKKTLEILKEMNHESK